MKKPRNVKARDWPVYLAGVKEGRYQMRMELFGWFKPFWMDDRFEMGTSFHKAMKWVVMELANHIKMSEDEFTQQMEVDLKRHLEQAQQPVGEPTQETVDKAAKQFPNDN